MIDPIIQLYLHSTHGLMFKQKEQQQKKKTLNKWIKIFCDICSSRKINIIKLEQGKWRKHLIRGLK